MKTLIISLGFVLLAPYLKADGLAVNADDKAFFRELKTAVVNDDRGKLAALVLYPITVHVEEKDITLTNVTDCVSNYSKIVTEKVKASIRAQEIGNLTKSWRGIMVGDGEVWFDRIKRPDDKEFIYRIVGFNP